MAKEVVDAGHYAQAVFRIALENNELDRWEKDLASIAEIADDAAIIGVLENPCITFDDKVGILSGLRDEVNPLAVNLVYLLIRNRDLRLLAPVADEFRRIRSARDEIEQATVTTAVPLEPDEMEKLKERLETMIGKKVTVETVVDPEIIGGFIARVGDKLIDGSIRTRLTKLKRQLSNAGN